MRMVHDTYHTSVMSTEVLDYLTPTKHKKYIDATLGGGGHTLEILKKGANVLGLDVDQDSVEEAQKVLASRSSEFSFFKTFNLFCIFPRSIPPVTMVFVTTTRTIDNTTIKAKVIPI